jgi:hypothetical protein
MDTDYKLLITVSKEMLYSCRSLVLPDRALLKELKCKDRQAKHNLFIRLRLVLFSELKMQLFSSRYTGTLSRLQSPYQNVMDRGFRMSSLLLNLDLYVIKI